MVRSDMYNSVSSLYDEDTTPHDKEMENKLSDFMRDQDMEDGFADDSSADASTVRELNVPDSLPENRLDHIVLACCNLKNGMAQFEDMTGIKPIKIGTLLGVGTKSARVALNNTTYVEIVGPDDKTTSEGMGPVLLDLPEGKLVPFHYSVRNEPESIELPEDLGWDRDDIVMVFADPEDYLDSGELHKWDEVFMYGHGLGGVVPTFVNWRENRFHPTSRLPKTSAKLEKVEVSAPSGNHLHTLLSKVPSVKLVEGKPKLAFTLKTPNGKVKFSASRPHGIVMPGFGDDSHPSMSKYSK